MFFRARNGSVCIDDTDMDYVSFGKGNNTLIMLPGLADGLATVKGMALTLLGVLKLQECTVLEYSYIRLHYKVIH